MNQKQLNAPATKEDLLKLEHKMETMEGRQDKLEQQLSMTEKQLRLEIRLTVEESTRRIESSITKFKDLILTTVDPLLQELETRREDRALATYQMNEVKQRIDHVEERVDKLEKTHHN